MEEALNFVVAKFPDHGSRIKVFFDNDEDFRVLCKDLMTSLQTLEKYRLNQLKNKEFELAYLEIYLDLEKELTSILKSSDPYIKGTD